jgi:glycosyltransferase involved in cell wall biosynthesis
VVRNGRRPRILFLVNTDWFFVSHRLGIGTALRDAGYEVVLAAAESDARRTVEQEGIRFVRVPFEPGSRSPFTETRTLAAIVDLYRREQPDLVHHVTIKPVLYGSAAARALRAPAIINAVSGLGYVFIDRDRPSVRHRAQREAIKAAYRVALGARRSRTIFQNPDDLGMFSDLGLVHRDRAVLIRGSGVDLSRFHSTPLPEGAPLVVVPARMLWDKGIGELVAAARVVRASRPDVRFALVGGADSQNPAAIPKAQLRAWEAEGVVEWWEHRTNMPEVFRSSHLVVLPSYREGLPLALAEAAASGRATVTTDVPGCREVVRDGETGWLVRPREVEGLASAIERALSDRGELQKRGHAGRKLAEAHLSSDAVIARTMEVYRELLPAGQGPHTRSRD